MPTVTLSAFKKNPAAILRQLKKKHLPVQLTVHGTVEAVLILPDEKFDKPIIEEILPGDPDYKMVQKLKAEDANSNEPPITLAELKKEFGL